MRQLVPESVASVEDLYELPDDGLHYELIGGRLVAEPSPGAQHGVVAATLVGFLAHYLRDHRHGVVLTCDTGFVLHRSPDTVRAPDVAFIRRERYLNLQEPRKAIPGAPDLAIEVLSPNNREQEMHAKVADYLAAGTTLVWIVDPEHEHVCSYRNLFEPQWHTGPDTLSAEDLLPGFSLTVSQIFEI